MYIKIIHFLLLLLLCIFQTTEATAQFRKVLHKTFELEKAEEINFDLAGEVEMETWSGNVIMTETTVFLGNASASMLNHFVEKGRYDIIASDPDSTVVMVITSKIKEREAVKLRRWVDKELVEIDAEERVAIKVFIPEEYESQDEAATVWKRKAEELPEVPMEKDTVRAKSGSE
ncbi:MAG: hypothetical protein AAF849_21705 [Bacteroidota bacterium]